MLVKPATYKLPPVLTLILVFQLLISSSAFANFFDATGDLEGKSVVVAGDIKSLDCPTDGKYDCDFWPIGLLKFTHKDICMTAGISVCGFGCKGLIAVGDDKVPYLFTIKEMRGELEKNRAKLYRCPAIY